jgi:hypothetical protein
MSKIAGMQYTIGSPTRLCAASGKTIDVGEKFIAALTQSLETEEFVRQDYSEDAWAHGSRPKRPLVLLGFWKAHAHEGEHKRRLLIDDDSLIDLFQQTEGAGPDERERLVFRFVLSLILLRKRLLVQEGSKGSTMLVRERGVPKPPEGPALIEVVDPELDDAAIAAVTAQLAAVLAGDQEPAPAGSGGGAQ